MDREIVGMGARRVRETDEVLEPVVVEGELIVRRHPARGQFPAVVELQGRKARLIM